MKSFVISCIISVLIVVGSIIHMEYIEDVSKTMCEYTHKIQLSIESDDFSSAEMMSEELSLLLEKKRCIISSTMDHSMLDSIEKNLAELCAYTNGRQKHDALSKCEVLDLDFRHIPKNFTLKLENIL